jgi:hypothetical protein
MAISRIEAGGNFTKICSLVFFGFLSFVIAGCGIHQSTGWKVTSKKIVAYTVEDFQKQGSRLCPFGFDVVGEIPVFVEGKENTRYIRCRMMQ